MDVRSRGTAVAPIGALFAAVGLAVALAVGGVAVWPGVVRAGTDVDAAERAAQAISAARERANALADELWAAQSTYDLLGEEAERLETEIARLERDVDDLLVTVEAVAVGRFVASGADGIPLLTDVRAPNERMRADVLAGVIADVGATTLDDYAAARAALDDARAELDANRRASERQQERLERLRDEAEDEVQRLRAAEQQRLDDEAVQRALAAQLAEEQRQRDEAERRAAEAARQAEIDGAAAAAVAAATPGVGDTVGNAAGPADGSTVGGRTGVTGGGSASPALGVGGSGGGPFVDSIACPVVGGSAYGDTWGAPRSGGRRHQGVDMLAPIGTPLAAVVAGTVEHRTNRLGGITVSLAGANGHSYYYAHLSAWEGSPGTVSQGQVIGYVGDSGNATGVPHLHFEIRPNGGVPVNPTPSVRAAGC